MRKTFQERALAIDLGVAWISGEDIDAACEDVRFAPGMIHERPAMDLGTFTGTVSIDQLRSMGIVH